MKEELQKAAKIVHIINVVLNVIPVYIIWFIDYSRPISLSDKILNQVFFTGMIGIISVIIWNITSEHIKQKKKKQDRN